MNNIMRKAFLKIHRWIAIPFGVFISIICFTGALQVFRDEIVRELNRDLYHIPVPENAVFMEDSLLVQTVLAQLLKDTRLTFIRIPAKAGAPAQANVAGMGQKNLFINPFTGAVLGYEKHTAFSA